MQFRFPCAVFCDFDGTIAVEDTFVALIEEFAPEPSARLLPELYARRVTLADGVREILGSIPSGRYAEAIAYASATPVRDGLVQFLFFLDARDIPFHVVSGGLRDTILRVLRRERLLEQIASIAAVDIDTSGPFLAPSSDFEDATELVAKAQVLARYPADTAIAIGDSLTDINLALNADLVFARDRLADYLVAAGKPFIPWDSFADIRAHLSAELALAAPAPVNCG